MKYYFKEAAQRAEYSEDGYKRMENYYREKQKSSDEFDTDGWVLAEQLKKAQEAIEKLTSELTKIENQESEYKCTACGKNTPNWWIENLESQVIEKRYWSCPFCEKGHIEKQ